MITAQRIAYGNEINNALIRSIIYFDIFDYPITASEAIKFAPYPIDRPIEKILDELVVEKIVFKNGEYYSLRNDPALVARRIYGKKLAEKRLLTARRFSKLIASFPFVKAVLLSGSISKGYMDKKSDIDYFIVTDANRLWIVRTALVIFRRLFLFNSHRNFCTNYFVDTRNLEIPDKNLFVATELITLMPLCGNEATRKLFEANQWVFNYLPQANFNEADLEDTVPRFTKLSEKVFADGILSSLNRWLMNRTKSYWKRKYANKVSESDFEIAFRTQPGVSKSHPRFFQRRTLDTLAQNIKAFESRHGIDLSL